LKHKIAVESRMGVVVRKNIVLLLKPLRGQADNFLLGEGEGHSPGYNNIEGWGVAGIHDFESRFESLVLRADIPANNPKVGAKLLLGKAPSVRKISLSDEPQGSGSDDQKAGETRKPQSEPSDRVVRRSLPLPKRRPL